MTLADIKDYLSARINTSDLLALTDNELTKYMNTAGILLDTFYYIDQVKEEQNLVMITSEEMIFLFNSNIDLNLFYRYEGMTEFAIGENAIKGKVDYSIVGDLFSPLVKSILESLGIDEKIDSPNKKVKNAFTYL